VSVHPYVGDKPGADVMLSRPELGAVDAKAGLEAATDRAGGTVVAWVQGIAADRRIVAGYFDRPPLRFAGYTGQRCCRSATPLLTWQEAFNLWGPTRYEILVDGVLVGQSATTALRLTTPLKGGTHRWQVRAVDIRGGATRSKTRLLRIDDHKPLLTVHYKRAKRVVTIAARARDDARSGPLASGLAGIVVSWGDRGSGARGRFDVHATHRYSRNGTYALTVTATDVAGNAAVSTRTVRIG
jgi:hypothetical protein